MTSEEQKPHCIADKIELYVRYLCDVIIAERFKFSYSLETIEKYYSDKERYRVQKVFGNKDLYSVFELSPLKDMPEIKEIASIIVKAIRGELFYNGRKPSLIAASIVYLAAMMWGEPIAQKTLSFTSRLEDGTKYSVGSSGAIIKMAHEVNEVIIKDENTMEQIHKVQAKS